MSMFDFGFDDLEDSADPSRLSNLVNSYERNGEGTYFDSDALEDIATYYFERGRFEDALGVIDRILENQPYSSDNWMRRGILLNNLGKKNVQLFDIVLSKIADRAKIRLLPCR